MHNSGTYSKKVGGRLVVFVHSKIQSWEHLCVCVANFEISVFVHRKIILRRHFHLVSKIPIFYLNWAKFRGYDENEKGPPLNRGTFSFSSYPPNIALIKSEMRFPRRDGNARQEFITEIWPFYFF